METPNEKNPATAPASDTARHAHTEDDHAADENNSPAHDAPDESMPMPPPLDADGTVDIEILRLLANDADLLGALTKIAAGEDRDAALRQILAPAPAASAPGTPVGSLSFLSNIRPDFWD